MSMTTESTPLTDLELSRLDELALERIAAGQDGPCPECNLEPGLVVRLVAEVRELRQRDFNAKCLVAYTGERLR
jgi:hypothetical protein